MSELLTLPEVGAALRVGRRTVERMIAEGELRSSKIRGRRLVAREEVERYQRLGERRGRVA